VGLGRGNMIIGDAMILFWRSQFEIPVFEIPVFEINTNDQLDLKVSVTNVISSATSLTNISFRVEIYVSVQ